MKELITQMLEGAEPSIRFEILERFSDLADCENDVRTMLKLLETDADPCVRHEAAAQIYRIEEKKPQLMTNLREQAIATLIDKAWNDESTVVRHESIEVLGYLGDERSLKDLSELATDKNLDISSTAEIALRTAQRRMAWGIGADTLCSDIIAHWQDEQRLARG
jgi:HEAT repeat protein